MKKYISLLLIMIMLFSSAPAFAASSDVDAVDIVVDTFILRPAGIVSTVLGSTVFVVSLPFALITSSVGKSFELLVQDPFQYTFTRPLGKIKAMD